MQRSTTAKLVASQFSFLENTHKICNAHLEVDVEKVFNPVTRHKLIDVK